LVVPSERAQPAGEGRVGGHVHGLRAVAQDAEVLGPDPARAGVGGLGAEHPVQLQRVADRFVHLERPLPAGQDHRRATRRAHGPVQSPAAGGAGARAPPGDAGCAAATSSACSSVDSRTGRALPAVAAKPHLPSARTRTPTPACSTVPTRATRPLRAAARSLVVTTWRASAYSHRPAAAAMSSVNAASTSGYQAAS